MRVNEAAALPDEAPNPLLRDDVIRLIDQTLSTTQTAMHASYVAKGKVDGTTYAAYFEAIRDRLTEQFVHQNGKALTNYRALRKQLPDLSHEAYGRKHRAIFEYLSKCTREHLVNQLRRAF